MVNEFPVVRFQVALQFPFNGTMLKKFMLLLYAQQRSGAPLHVALFLHSDPATPEVKGDDIFKMKYKY